MQHRKTAAALEAGQSGGKLDDLVVRNLYRTQRKFLGTGEKIEGLDVFDARRIAGRILGQGDVVALVERAVENANIAEAEKMAAQMAKGKFDLDVLANQLRQIQNMGGLGGIMGMLPGAQQAKKALESGAVNEKMVSRQIAVISSMT